VLIGISCAVRIFVNRVETISWSSVFMHLSVTLDFRHGKCICIVWILVELSKIFVEKIWGETELIHFSQLQHYRKTSIIISFPKSTQIFVDHFMTVVHQKPFLCTKIWTIICNYTLHMCIMFFSRASPWACSIYATRCLACWYWCIFI